MAHTEIVLRPGLRILLVEDDLELRGMLARGLEDEGFVVATAGTGAEAIERVRATAPEALIIDIGLPDADGRDLCQALRARGVQAPVLFLTARDAMSDRLSGFAAGGEEQHRHEAAPDGADVLGRRIQTEAQVRRHAPDDR